MNLIVTVESVTSKVGSGATPRGGKSVYTSVGVAFIRSQNVLDNRMKSDEIARLSESAAHELRNVEVESGDVLLNITGDSVARCCLADPSLLPARVSQHVAIVRANERVDPRFLQRVLVNPPMKKKLLSMSDGGGTRRALTKSMIESLEIPCPPLPQQRAIAEVLGALDDKIEINGRTLTIAHQLILAKFEAAIQLGRDLVRVGDAAIFHNRHRVPLSSRDRELRRGSVPYYGAASVLDYVDSALFDEPLVLVGEDGSVVRDDGRPVIQYVWGKSWVNNHAHVLTGRTVSTELLRVAIERTSVAHLVTGAVQPKISMGNLKSLVVAVPKVTNDLDRQIRDLTAVTRSLADENRVLAAARDELLPLLMSGRIRVRDAERQAEDVL